MSKCLMTTLLSVVFLLGIASPSMAHDRGSWEHTNHYLRAKVIKLSGDRDRPGCDLVAKKCDQKRTQESVHRYFETMRGMIAPAPAPVVASYPDAAPAQTSSPPVASSSSGSSNSMVNPACESGGNPQVVDPSGTYWGKYQFDQGTWVAHGGSPGSYGSASEAEQDRVAANVQYDAWPNC